MKSGGIAQIASGEFISIICQMAYALNSQNSPKSPKSRYFSILVQSIVCQNAPKKPLFWGMAYFLARFLWCFYLGPYRANPLYKDLQIYTPPYCPPYPQTPYVIIYKYIRSLLSTVRRRVSALVPLLPIALAPPTAVDKGKTLRFTLAYVLICICTCELARVTYALRVREIWVIWFVKCMV